MDSPMKYNPLGVAFVSDDLPRLLQKKVDKKMEELEEKIEASRQNLMYGWRSMVWSRPWVSL